jgi:nitrogen fixation/metabolism regulation signal transduction histidine kinase
MKIRTKIILIFFLISILPLVLAGGAGFYHINEVSNSAINITTQSLRNQSELTVNQITKKIANFIDLYVNRFVQDDNYAALQYDPDFTSLAIQTIGKSGYSFVLKSEGDKLKVFMHPNPRMLNKDLGALDIQKLPSAAARVMKTQEDFQGYLGNQYCFVHQVHGQPLYVVSLISDEDINESVNQLKQKFAAAKQDFLLQYNIGGLATGAIVLLLALLFAIRLVRPITQLTNVAEKISLGDLKTSIDISSSDEIGELADALRRMQSSLLKAVQRLQRRK